jgi:hypothetical protein
MKAAYRTAVACGFGKKAGSPRFSTVKQVLLAGLIPALAGEGKKR